MSATSLEERSHRSLLVTRPRFPFHDIDASPRGRPKEGALSEGEEVMRPPMCEAVWGSWRSELLQVMFWLKEEGFGEEADATLLERFLGVDARVDVQHLERLLGEGYVERVGDRYKLSETGARKGGVEFAASFEGLMKPTYGECGLASSCQNLDDEFRVLK